MPLPKLEDLLVLLPGGLVGIVLAMCGLVLVRAGISQEHTRLRHAIGALLVVVAVPVGAIVTWFATHDGLPRFDGGATERALIGCALVAIAVAAAAASRSPLLVRASLWIALVGVVFLTLRTLIQRAPDASGYVSPMLATGIGIGVAAFATLGELSVRRDGPAAGLFALSISLGAAGQIALLLGSAVLGQLAGTAAIVVSVVAMSCLVAPRILPAAPLVSASAAGFLVIIGVLAAFFGAESLPVAVAIAVPMAASAGLLGRLRWFEGRAFLRFAVPISFAMLVAGAAVFVTASSAAEKAKSDPYSDFR
ncbi:MAG: hypothetical protein H6832_01115 [Planctomycetes bacterium]|nr:hypothetical protein [Planctomycetota bacterium]MCB9916984.1 hypothetical protein [Planctomycetota bacterium]